MADDNDTERTESASPRRLEQAREEGQLARSQELTTFALLMAGGGGLWWLGGRFFGEMRGLLRHGLQIDAAAVSDPAQMTTRLYDLAVNGLFAMAPLLGVLLVVALCAPQLLSGWNFSVNALRCDWQRLDPVAGLGRVVSWRGAAELIKALVKSALITAVAPGGVWHFPRTLPHLPVLRPRGAGTARPPNPAIR